jgi:hypothetical protein
MDGSTVIADGGSIKFIDDNGNSVLDEAADTDGIGYNEIEFEDFYVKDSDETSYIEGTLVADIINYTTLGDYTTSALGKITI